MRGIGVGGCLNGGIELAFQLFFSLGRRRFVEITAETRNVFEDWPERFAAGLHLTQAGFQSVEVKVYI